MKQIADKQYAATLRSAGVTDIFCLAITFDGKRVWVKEDENEGEKQKESEKQSTYQI